MSCGLLQFLFFHELLWSNCSALCGAVSSEVSLGLAEEVNVSLWCLHGTLSEHEILQHKRLQLLQHGEFGGKQRTCVCLNFSTGVGLLAGEPIEDLRHDLRWELQDLWANVAPGHCDLIASLANRLLEPELLGTTASRWALQHQTLLLVATGGSYKDLELWCWLSGR